LILRLTYMIQLITKTTTNLMSGKIIQHQHGTPEQFKQNQHMQAMKI
jgi:hypothetical protein